jgi:hypothetical protein
MHSHIARSSRFTGRTTSLSPTITTTSRSHNRQNPLQKGRKNKEEKTEKNGNTQTQRNGR